MEDKALVINPDDEQARCIRIKSLKKLPTMAWCLKEKDIALVTLKEYTVVWEGLIGISKYNILNSLFDGHK